MAGILTDVSSDIQKLQNLKIEIENVKKALKGINIKVDIDIAKGLQSQLKSLTNQYHEMVDKIAQAEAKILLSAKKINDASEKIIQAQEKVSKSVNTPAQTGNANTQASTAEIASIQAQAKAYDDLRTEINNILGTREENVKRMIDEMNAIRLINAEIKKINKSQGDYSSLSSAQQKRLEQLNNSLLTHKTALSEVRQALNNNAKLDNATATSMNGLSQSLSRMRIAYRELTEEERKSPFGKELLSSINQADAKIKELDATIGNHQRNVGDYAKQWNGLQYQMQIVARELPNFAINPQIGIMSLTNNLPYLVDELKKAKDAHKAYVAEVKAGNKDLKAVPSVGKQVLSSLLSWQTALVMGITLITAYRKEISDWIVGLFKAKDVAGSLMDIQSKINEAQIQGKKNAKSELSELSTLYNASQSEIYSKQERLNIIKKLQQEYPDYFGNLSKEAILAGRAEDAYNKLAESITKSAIAKAYSESITQNEKEIIDLENELDKLLSKSNELQKEQNDNFNKLGKGAAAATNASRQIYELGKKIADNEDEVLKKQTELRSKQIEKFKLQSRLNSADLIFNANSSTAIEGTKQYWANQKKEAETALDAIDSKQRELMNVGKFEGIDAAVIKSYKDNVKKLKEAEKELKVYDSSTKQESQAEKLRKEQEKYALLMDEQALEQKRSAEDLQMKVDEARIKAMDEGSAKTIAEMELNFEKEMQAIDRQKEDALRKKIEDARSAWEANPENKGKSFDATGVELSDDEQKYFDELYKSAIAVNEKTKLRSEADAMRDYLKEYGTFQQQKLAIAEEYADKIEKATTKGERLSLEKQRDSAIQQVDIKALEQKIDWQAVFGDISGILGSQLKETLEGLKEYVKTDKFNSSSETDKQIVYDAIDRLSEVTPGGEGTLNFSKIKAQMDSLGASISKYQAATIAQTLAQDNLKKATDNYNNALKGGSSEQIENAKIGLSMAQNAAKIADDAYNSAASDVRNLGEEYKLTSADTIDGLNLVAAGLQGFANKSLPSIFSGLQSTLTGLSKLNIGGAVGDAIGKLSQTLSSAGVIGQIISAILSILDILKDGIGPLISGIIDSILGAINGILDNILSGDMFVQIFSSIKNGIGNILNTISFGGFNSLFGIGGNKKEVEEAINRLTDRNETLQTAIEDLTDVMEASKGTKSVAAYTDAKKLQKETEDNYKKIAQEQARYSGSHHSWNYYWGGFNQEETSRLSNQIGRNWNGDIWSLSPEEMKMLRSNVDMWEKIQSAGKGGYGERLTEKLDDYIDQAGKMEELTDKLYEGLTGISFDSMYDSFIDTLMDMDASAEDSANKISEYFMRAMLSNKIGELYSDKLEEWWKKFGASMEDNELTETEREALQDEYMQYVEEAMKLRDELASATGYDKISSESTSQSSTSKGFGTEMTHEDAGELSGRFTALQIAGEEIKNQNIDQSQSLNLLTAKTDAILSVNTETRNIADDTRDLIAQSYLELVQISENTGNSAKYLKDIKADIAEVKNNTKGLSSR